MPARERAARNPSSRSLVGLSLDAPMYAMRLHPVSIKCWVANSPATRSSVPTSQNASGGPTRRSRRITGTSRSAKSRASGWEAQLATMIASTLRASICRTSLFSRSSIVARRGDDEAVALLGQSIGHTEPPPPPKNPWNNSGTIRPIILDSPVTRLFAARLVR